MPVFSPMLAKEFLHSVRGLRKNPAFTVTAVATIALGIGASTAIFSVVNAVLLQPLPYRDPGRLAFIESDMRHRNVVDFPFSAPDFDDLRRSTTQFQEVAAVNTNRGVAVRDESGEPELIPTAGVTPNFFHLLGARIALGRDFTATDCTLPPRPAAGAPPAPPTPAIAILSDELWTRRFGRDPGVLGRSIDFGNGKAQIVGVLEPGFELLFPPKAGVESRPEIWIAMRVDYTQGRNDVFLHLIGRLKPGATIASAQSEADRFAADLRRQFSIKETAGLYLRVEPMQQHLVADVRPTILALMGAVIFLLLIACANVANLLLVRAAVRGRELAVRAALGGSRWDLVRQMLAESTVLAVPRRLAGTGPGCAGHQSARLPRAAKPAPAGFGRAGSAGAGLHRAGHPAGRGVFRRAAGTARLPAGHHGRAARSRPHHRAG